MNRDQIQEGNVLVSHCCSLGSKYRTTLPGFPATTACAGTSFVTTAPAPISAYSPITRLARIVAPDPIDAPFFTNVVSTFQSASVWREPAMVVARGKVSFTKVTLWPI